MKRDNRRNIAAALEDYRLSRLWTYAKLSEETGLSVTALYYLAKGKVKPHKLTVAILKAKLPGFLDPAA